MWEKLMRAVQEFDAEGRARFTALTTDTERLINTKATAVKFSLIGWVALLVPCFLALAAVILHFGQGVPLPGTFWLYLFWWCIWLSGWQGTTVGYILGWSVGLYWQGNRRKAGYTALGGGAVCLAILALTEALCYQATGLPLYEFVFWAFIVFSPAYITLAGMVAWGLNLLGKD